MLLFLLIICEWLNCLKHCTPETHFLLLLQVKALQRLNYQYPLFLEELKPFSLNVKHTSVNFLLLGFSGLCLILCTSCFDLSCRFWYELAADLGKGMVKALPWCLCPWIGGETGMPCTIPLSPGMCLSRRVVSNNWGFFGSSANGTWSVFVCATLLI